MKSPKVALVLKLTLSSIMFVTLKPVVNLLHMRRSSLSELFYNAAVRFVITYVCVVLSYGCSKKDREALVPAAVIYKKFPPLQSLKFSTLSQALVLK